MIDGILNDIQLKEVEEGIFSCLSKPQASASYDDKANGYDLLIGNRFYNKFIWGNWPDNYQEFCRQALERSHGGIYLDAGCGSLVFTADIYSEANNQLIILLDRSITMLVKGRDRLKKLNGSLPNNILFLQGDIFHLPFKDHVFDTVASFGVLHIFDDKMSVLNELERVKGRPGQLFLSSLTGNNTIGRRYLKLLERAGEVATFHTSDSLAALLSERPIKYKFHTIGNMTYATNA